MISILAQPASAAVTELYVSPANPVLGDTITVSGTASPGESINAIVSFKKNVSALGDEYNYTVGDVEIPKDGSNRFSVTATGVKELWVSVKMFGIIPWTISEDATGNTAKIAQSNVPGGTHEVKIGGLAENGNSVDLLISATLTIEADSTGHFEYPYKTSSIPAGDFELNVGGIQKTITLNSGLTTSSKDSNSSGGSASAGGSSGEPESNIVSKETFSKNAYKDIPVSCQLSEPSNPLMYVNFTTKKNVMEAPVLVEILHETSSFAITKPDGIAYRNINIWIGYTGFATASNISDATVSFKVDKDWITINNIDPQTIMLMHYDENTDTWEMVPTQKIGEGDIETYYNAFPSEFSPFAITGEREEDIKKSTASQTPTDEQATTEVPSRPVKSETNLLYGLFVGIVLLATIAIIRRKK